MKVNEKIGDIIEAEIKDLAFDGKSVGTLNGKIIFLNGGLPGEKVRARITRKKRNFSVGKVLDIISKSNERISAPCWHFDICGGCTWQDLGYERQLSYKRKQVIDCLEHIGKLKNIEVKDIIGAKDKFFYRNKMEFSFNSTDDGGFNLGLHRRGKFDEIFNVEKCLLQSERSNRIVNSFRDFVTGKKLPVYDVERHTGLLRFLVIREGKNTDQVMINIVTSDGEIPGIDEWINEIISEIPQIRTIVHNINRQKSNIAYGEKENVLYGDGFIEDSILGRHFRIFANSFFQTNTKQAENLYSKAYEYLIPKKDDHLLDLYCGTGTIGICASDKVDRVLGIELEPSSIRAAEENASLNNITNIEFRAASVQDILRIEPELFSDITCAIVDPPRAGLHPKALKQLISINLPRLVYISCNPSTFARDAAKLVDSGYEISSVTPVDMFPHTMHIELVAGLQKINNA